MPPPPEGFPTTPNVDPNIVYNNYISTDSPPNYCGSKVPVQSDLNIHAWKQYAAIIDPVDPTLIPQLEFGFSMAIDYSHDIQVPVTNHPSAKQEYTVIDDFIVKHYSSGALLGPYKVNPFPVPIFPSPMQVVTSASGKKRPVIDMSYPKYSSVNSAIPKQWCEIPGFDGVFKLPTHDDVCKAILTTEDPRMFLVDLKAYYMQLPSDWRDTPYMCVVWRGGIYLHRRLPFGCRTSCLHAQRVTDAIVLIYTRHVPANLSGYVDDFCSIVRSLLSASAFAKFNALLDELGLRRTLEKCVPPALVAVFLGLLYHLRDMYMALPDDKLARALTLMQSWLERDQCTKAQLQSLLGHLNHIATVLHAARPFTSSIVDLLREDHFPASVTPEIKQDIEMWINFLSSEWSKKSIIKSQDMATPDELLRVAVRHRTFVIYCCGELQGYVLHDHEPSLPPHAMYAVAVWLAVQKHGQLFENQVVKISVPYKAAVVLLNRARTPCVNIRKLVREMWLDQARLDCVVKAVLSPVKNNDMYEMFHNFIPVKLPH